ncbi:aminotransferase class III-fold pyridoxal phosphate-dependent enzyme [Deferribacteraceae bacterium V6Fe1]|nr:aminotransferase class III-fold pyridoxal phosphate-dependent enzyme [Deferribacteraceae bacterium V6Fe1]
MKELNFKRYSEKFSKSKELFDGRFLNTFPTGVCHDIRFFEPFPFVVKKSKGPYIYSIEGNKLIDLWMGHYANILGHGNKYVLKQVVEVEKNGWHTGIINEYQVKLAELIKSAIPEIEKLRFCTSGTEATMYATRLARGYTGKNIVVKIKGGWHGGNSDLAYQVKPPFENRCDETIAIPFNKIEESKEILDGVRQSVACIIIEPVLGAGGGIAAEESYLKFLRKFCDENRCLLIFDETITGFRFRFGSVSKIFKVKPDIITMGKIIGGGFPIGCYGGKREVMDLILSKKIITGGGTFSALAPTMAAGIATLEQLEDLNYAELNNAGENLINEISDIMKKLKINALVKGFKSLFSISFFESRFDFNDLSVSNILNHESHQFDNLFKIILINKGLYSMHGGGALSFSHLESKLEKKVIDIYSKALKEFKKVV